MATGGSLTLGLLILLLQGLTVFTGTAAIGPSAALNSFPGGDFLGDLACQFVECGYGKCRATSDVPGYECVCDAGWKTHKAAPFTSAACILPNCTVDLKCDKTSMLTSASTPASLHSSDANNATLHPDCNNKTAPEPSPSPSDGACKMVWCGEGKCVEKETGSGYHCQCHHGASNLFNNTSWACYKPCSLGSNCYSLSTCPHNLQPPSPPPSAPPPNGASARLHLASLILQLLFIVLLAVILQAPV